MDCRDLSALTWALEGGLTTLTGASTASGGGLRTGGDNFAEGGERPGPERVEIGEVDTGDVEIGDVGSLSGGTMGRGLTLPCDAFLARSRDGLTAAPRGVRLRMLVGLRSSDCFVGVVSSNSFFVDGTTFGGD